MNPALLSPSQKASGVLADLALKHGFSMDEIKGALKWIMNPTKRPIVGVKEFIESPYYMNARDESGKSTIYPLVMKELEEMNNGTYSEAVLTGAIGCVSADTEFLSPSGWVRMDQWSGQKVMQVSASGVGSFVTPTTYVVKPCGWFFHLRTKYGVDQKLSPEHRVWYETTKGNGRFIPALDLYKQHESSKLGWTGKFYTTFKPSGLAGVGLSEAQIRVQVMAQADGTFPAHLTTNHCILNLKKDRKKERAEALLESAGIPYKRTEHADGYSRIAFKAPLRTKRFSDWAWGCDAEQLAVISSECVLWDGHKRTYYSTHESDADFIQYAMTASGLRAIKEFDGRALAPHWRVRGNPNVKVGIQGSPTKTPIKKVASTDGRKYCFEVPEGRFVIRLNGRVAVTGNSAKTTCALYTTAYQLYVLSCYDSPHGLYGLDPASEIVFIFQSLNATAARRVDYDRFKAMIERSPYFQEHFPFDKDIESELHFPKRIIVRPVSGAETAAIGQNVFGGIIDEVNFMAVIEGGKNAGENGVYDQAVALYNSISKRRKSRFGSAGKLPGMLCLVSSRRYPGQFTDIKEAEAREEIARTGRTSIFIYDKRTWEIKPPGSYLKETFDVFIGDEARKPRIMEPGEKDRLPEHFKSMVVTIPMDFLDDFKRDLLSSLRDIAGVATLARHPFIVNRESIAAAMRRKNICFAQEWVDFEEVRLSINFDQIVKPDLPRFFHGDLAITGDSAGFAIGTVTGFKTISPVPGVTELLPVVHIDALLEIKPPKGQEIKLGKIRDVIYTLRSLGLNIRWGTFDQFQSRDSMQLLRQSGISVGYQSVDLNATPYEFVKNALYDQRLSMPYHAKCLRELSSLEKIVKGRVNKVDHPQGGSKDVSDALAGVVYGLTMRREIWALHGVAAIQIPQSIREVISSAAQQEKIHA